MPDESAIERCKTDIDLATDEELQLRMTELKEYMKEAKGRQKQINTEVEKLFGQEQKVLFNLVRNVREAQRDIGVNQTWRHGEALFTKPGWYRARGDRYTDKNIELLFYMLKPRRKRKDKFVSTVTGVLLAKATASHYHGHGGGNREPWRIGWACIYMTITKQQLLRQYHAHQWAKLNSSEKLQLVIDGSPIEKFEHRLKKVYGKEKPVRLMRSFTRLSELADCNWRKAKKAYPLRVLRDDTSEAPLAKELQRELRNEHKDLNF